jgi:NADPH-dependent 2,4-dienoyl-CoA reductase/sulfur reductase-like enzyme
LGQGTNLNFDEPTLWQMPAGTASAPLSYEENGTDNFKNEKIMTSAPPTPGSLPRIIIVGGGFGGLAAARALKKARAHVDLIDKTNHHVFQPLLYQVATGLLSPEHIASPPRRVCATPIQIFR